MSVIAEQVPGSLTPLLPHVGVVSGNVSLPSLFVDPRPGPHFVTVGKVIKSPLCVGTSVLPPSHSPLTRRGVGQDPIPPGLLYGSALVQTGDLKPLRLEPEDPTVSPVSRWSEDSRGLL